MRFGKKASSMTGYKLIGDKQVVWSKFDYTKAGMIFNNIDIAYAAINLYATEASQAKIKLFSVASDKSKREILDHELIALLNNPSPNTDGSELIYGAFAFRKIAGDVYLFANTGVDGKDDYKKQPIDLELRRPERMKVVVGTTGVIGYEYTVNGVPVAIAADPATGESNITHWKTFNPLDDVYGLSPTKAAMKPLDIYEKVEESTAQILTNDCRPSGLMRWTGEGTAPENALKAIKAFFSKTISDGEKGKTLITDGRFEYQQLSLNPKDMEHITTKNSSARDIAFVYGVDSTLLGIDQATWDNKKQARLNLWESSIIPDLKSFVNMLNNWIVPRYGKDLMLELDLSEVSALEPRREAMWKRATEATFISENEKRRMVGLEDDPDGDVTLVSSSMVPLSFAGSDLLDTATDDAKKKLY